MLRINVTYVYSINVFFNIEALPIPIARKAYVARASRQQRPRYVNETVRARARAAMSEARARGNLHWTSPLHYNVAPGRLFAGRKNPSSRYCDVNLSIASHYLPTCVTCVLLRA